MQLRVQPHRLIRRLFHSLNWRVQTPNKEVYITFDDGPIPEITPWVLNTLDEFSVKATFFCIGRNVERHPEVFKQIISRGHAVGNHSYSHYKGMFKKQDEYLSDIAMANDLIGSSIFRPPHGRINKQLIKILEESYKIIMWDVLSCDFDPKVPNEKCLQNVLKHSRNGSIIVFHDSVKAKENMMYSLRESLIFLKKEGYSFKTLA